MKNLRIFTVVFLVLVVINFSAFAQMIHQDELRPSLPVWTDGELRRFLKEFPIKPPYEVPEPKPEPEPFQAQIVLEPLPPDAARTRSDLVGVVINADIYPSLVYEINRYTSDLQSESWRVFVVAAKGGTPQDLRETLKEWLPRGLAGVVLIGDLPIPWFEMKDDFVGYNAFPCDLVYMDLDGEWGDADSNGIFDSHSGNKAPEVWLGRLTFSPMAEYGSEVAILRNYFVKNHEWRNSPGHHNNKQRSLLYVDDDWESYNVVLRLQNTIAEFHEVDFVNDIKTTSASDYLERLQQDYELVLLWTHGNINLENFGPGFSPITATDVVNTQPRGNFYILNSCSNLNYAGQYRPDDDDYISPYIGAAYLVSGDGLMVVGTTKVGGIINPDVLYYSLLEANIGDAFLNWWSISSLHINDFTMTIWNYGVTILGDPTLRLRTVAGFKEMALPSGPRFYNYPAVETPVASVFPLLTRPIGIGQIERGILDLQIALPKFTGPVDVYLVVQLPNDDVYYIYSVTPNLSLAPLRLDGLDSALPWLSNFEGPVNQSVYPLICTSALPPGRYNIFLAVTPAGKTDSFYLWVAYFDLEPKECCSVASESCPSYPSHCRPVLFAPLHKCQQTDTGVIECLGLCDISCPTGTEPPPLPWNLTHTYTDGSQIYTAVVSCHCENCF